MTTSLLAEEAVASTHSISEEKNKYYTASQLQLVWWRFRRNRMALLGGATLGMFFIIVLFAEIIAPYSGTKLDVKYILGPPQMVKFWDDNGFSVRPFVHGVKSKRDPITLQMISSVDKSKRLYVQFFVEGEKYKYFGVRNIHLFGLEKGMIHLFGTDKQSRDLFSRTMLATRTSLILGIGGVLIAFVVGLIMGGMSGFFGGWVDFSIQRLIEFVRSIPDIPLFMGLAAALPQEWPPEKVYFAITLMLGFLGWTTLARRIRGKLLSLRDEDYVVAAKLVGASNSRIIGRHMLPSFTSYIIVDLVVSFPYIILAETALSFVGLGLRPPVISWGVLLQGGQSIQAIESAPWLFIPVAFVAVAVMAFVFLGDGLRDAADPYSS